MAVRRRVSRAWSAAVLLALLVSAAAPAGAADDPVEPSGGDLVSGVEGSKAALVRIEVSATAEIAHVDHTTGEVEVKRGRYTVPIRTATGVFVSSDGIITTAGETLTVTEDEVVVYAANMLFQEQMGTALVGNDGDPARRAQAADAYWAPHLQHCYDHVEHCVLFFVEQYEVFPYMQEAAGTPADVLRRPEGPADAGLLRISGGGGTPTAQLAAPDHQPDEHGVLLGFTEPPAAGVTPTEAIVHADAAGALTTEGALGPPDSGLAGGPVVDPDSGEVVGLATVVDGAERLIPAGTLHEALEAAGVQATGSEFDAVFRRGVDHLAGGDAGASAASSFRESLTYYDSALAARYLEEAEAAGASDGESGTPAGDDDGGLLGGAGIWVLVGVLALLVLLASALVLRRRRASAGGPAHRPPREKAPLAATTASPRPEKDARPAATVGAPPAGHPVPAAPRAGAPGDADESRERTRLRQSPAIVKDPVPPARPARSFCQECGGALGDRARFCASCGSPVT